MNDRYIKKQLKSGMQTAKAINILDDIKRTYRANPEVYKPKGSKRAGSNAATASMSKASIRPKNGRKFVLALTSSLTMSFALVLTFGILIISGVLFPTPGPNPNPNPNPNPTPTAGLEFNLISDDSLPGGQNVYEISVGTATSKKVIIIPKEYNGVPVRQIAENGFKDCVNLTNIVIPDSVKIIGAAAFLGCENLTEIVLPDSIVAIGESAFKSCSSLENIFIPNSVIEIGSDAFLDCFSLTIYVDVEEEPSGWADNWHGGRTVVTI